MVEQNPCRLDRADAVKGVVNKDRAVVKRISEQDVSTCMLPDGFASREGRESGMEYASILTWSNYSFLCAIYKQAIAIVFPALVSPLVPTLTFATPLVVIQIYFYSYSIPMSFHSPPQSPPPDWWKVSRDDGTEREGRSKVVVRSIDPNRLKQVQTRGNADLDENGFPKDLMEAICVSCGTQMFDLSKAVDPKEWQTLLAEGEIEWFCDPKILGWDRSVLSHGRSRLIAGQPYEEGIPDKDTMDKIKRGENLIMEDEARTILYPIMQEWEEPDFGEPHSDPNHIMYELLMTLPIEGVNEQKVEVRRDIQAPLKTTVTYVQSTSFRHDPDALEKARDAASTKLTKLQERTATKASVVTIQGIKTMVCDRLSKYFAELQANPLASSEFSSQAFVPVQFIWRTRRRTGYWSRRTVDEAIYVEVGEETFSESFRNKEMSLKALPTFWSENSEDPKDCPMLDSSSLNMTTGAQGTDYILSSILLKRINPPYRMITRQRPSGSKFNQAPQVS